MISNLIKLESPMMSHGLKDFKRSNELKAELSDKERIYHWEKI
jgi:hypothetical protein